MGGTFERILAEAEASANYDGTEAGRQREIEACRVIWREGFVADAIVEHHHQEHWDIGSKKKFRGLMTKEDLQSYHAEIEVICNRASNHWPTI